MSLTAVQQDSRTTLGTASAAPKNGFLGGENQNKGGGEREVRWLTPRHLVEPLGQFDLDPCGAPGHSLAHRTFLLERGEDGLRLPWEGRVWLNPPYGRHAEPFLRKLADHPDGGTALIFARTETRLWHDLIWPMATAFLFLQGRVTFLNADGVAASSNAGAPSVLVAFGEHDAVRLQTSGIAGHFLASPAVPS